MFVNIQNQKAKKSKKNNQYYLNGREGISGRGKYSIPKRKKNVLTPDRYLN